MGVKLRDIQEDNNTVTNRLTDLLREGNQYHTFDVAERTLKQRYNLTLQLPMFYKIRKRVRAGQGASLTPTTPPAPTLEAKPTEPRLSVIRDINQVVRDAGGYAISLQIAEAVERAGGLGEFRKVIEFLAEIRPEANATNATNATK